MHHAIIHFNSILIIKRISMIDSFKKGIYHTFTSKNGLSIIVQNSHIRVIIGVR